MNVGLMQMHAFVAIIEDILSSHDKNQIHVQYHARKPLYSNSAVIA